MSLQIKYRPKTIEDLFGNDNIKKNLKQILARKKEDIPHAFLLSGPSGCGKTTLARIIASELGATEDNFNYKELNASDFRGIDTVREIRSEMALSPLKGKYRVYLWDEAHNITSDAQQAILKMLEEPPAHVVFILATTNPEKFPVTIKRRCTPFELSPLDDEDVFKYIRTISIQEKKKMTKEVLISIAEHSEGSLGMAMMLLDKVIDLEPEEAMQEIKEFKVLEDNTIDICRILMSKKPSWKEVAKILKSLKDSSVDPERVRRAVLGYAASVLLNGDNPKAYIILSCFKDNVYSSGFPGIVCACYEVCADI